MYSRIAFPVRMVRLGLCTLALALAAGCSANKKKASETPAEPASARQAAAPKPADKPARPRTPQEARYDALMVLGYRPQWSGVAIVESGQSTKFLDAVGDLVLLHSTGNALTALETSTGAARWSLDLGSELIKAIGNLRDDNGDVITCSETDLQILDGQTGLLKGRQRLAVLANTRPVRFGSMLIFGSLTGEVLGHNLISGFKQWGYDLTGGILADPVRVGPVVGVLSQGGEVAFLDPRSGSTLGGTRIYGGATTDPVADDTHMYIAGTDQSVWAFSAFGAERAWRVRTDLPLTEQPTLYNGRLYVAIAKEGLAAIDASSGQRLWTTPNLKGSVVAVRAGRLLFWDARQGTARLIDPERGDVLETVDLPGVTRIATSTLVDGDLFLAESKGLVQRFSARN